MPARKSAPKPSKPKTKPKAAPHGPPEGQDKPARRKAKAPPAKKAPAKKAAPARTPRGAAASKDRPITVREAKFAAEYVKDFNGTQAAIRAGYPKAGSRVAASRLLTRPNIRALLAPAEEKIEGENSATITAMELSVERTRQEIARIAYFDPRRMFGPDGRPLALHQMDDDTAAVIAGLEVLEAYEGSGEDRVMVGTIKKWKLADKNAALDKASKILGIYERDNEQKGKGAAEAIKEFFSAVQGARLPIVKPGIVKP